MEQTLAICKNCKQGYTREGYSMYPDHIELCPIHAAAPEMLEALLAFEKGLNDGSIAFTKKRQADSDPYHPANTLMCKAIAKAEGQEVGSAA